MSAQEEKLLVYLNEDLIGTVVRNARGRLRFSYEDSYRNRSEAIPLSLSMPLLTSSHQHEKIHPFLWGLLPDNELVIQRWAQRYHVSPSNVFGLLREIGDDCAGAIRFVPEDKKEIPPKGGLEALDESAIEARLHDLVRDPALGRTATDRGQFSLAGAQSKTALRLKDGQWFLPWGTEPTTHILKIPRSDLDGHIENEHFCLQLATALGLPAADSRVVRFGNQAAIVIDRYDRLQQGGRIIRIHQEDTCQALSIHPSKKYQSDAGPGISDIMELLNQSSNPLADRQRFIDYIVFNYLILGSDAHAKNFSLLLGKSGQVRLAKLYDVASLLPYTTQRKEQRFAMKIGGYYRDQQIFPRHFGKLGKECQIPFDRIRESMITMSHKIPSIANTVATNLKENRVEHSIVDHLAEALKTRIQKIESKFKTT